MKDGLSPFQSGMDFIIHFSGKKFTLDDIKDRYHCTYRNAVNLKNLAEGVVTIAPAGLSAPVEGRRGIVRNLWEMRA